MHMHGEIYKINKLIVPRRGKQFKLKSRKKKVIKIKVQITKIVNLKAIEQISKIKLIL